MLFLKISFGESILFHQSLIGGRSLIHLGASITTDKSSPLQISVIFGLRPSVWGGNDVCYRESRAIFDLIEEG